MRASNNYYRYEREKTQILKRMTNGAQHFAVMSRIWRIVSRLRNIYMCVLNVERMQTMLVFIISAVFISHVDVICLPESCIIRNHNYVLLV